MFKASSFVQTSSPLRQGIFLALLLIVGVVVGSIAIRILLPPVEGSVSSTEYVLLVAEANLRDNDLAAARARLSSLGDPIQVVQDARRAVINDPTLPLSAQEQLRQLAVKLDGGESSAAGPNQGAALQAVPAPAPSATGDLIVPIVAILVALVAGTFAAMRLLGISFPSSLRAQSQPQTMTEQEPPRFRTRAAPPQTYHSRLQPLAKPETARADTNSAFNGFKSVVESQHTAAPARAAAASSRSRVGFQSTYELGDDPYDEIHPIVDRETGVLLGACGLSASKWLEPAGSGKFYAFTAWLHDYVSDQELRSVGIVSRWALDQGRNLTEEWLQSGAIDDIVEAKNGGITRLETGSLAGNVTINESHYNNGTPAQSHFSRLSIRFEIFVKSGVSASS